MFAEDTYCLERRILPGFFLKPSTYERNTKAPIPPKINVRTTPTPLKNTPSLSYPRTTAWPGSDSLYTTVTSSPTTGCWSWSTAAEV